MRNSLFLIAIASTFNLSAQNLISGGVLKPEQAIMDIRHYTIALDVDPVQKTINGYTEIDFEFSKPAELILLDFWQGLTVSKIWVDKKEFSFTHGEDDLVRIKGKFSSGKHLVKVAYGGKPGVADRAPWTGGFQWEKDAKGNPWISITCQGEGAKIFFPCKDHPSDEPNEGADMIITVPKGLVVTAPGLLRQVSSTGNKSTYHWKTNYTISNYCILFNAGNYKLAQRVYTTVDGNKVPMEYYVLEENWAMADKMLDLFEQSARILEKYFGEYPWVKEVMRLSETPHLGMEHQTNIAYGNKYRFQKMGDKDFDWLLHHEFGHEWWANKVTNRDWAHMWIQEGICSYGDALATLELAGEEAYLKRMKSTGEGANNNKPLVQGEEVGSDVAYHGDIYGKGAFFMHTLRFVLGDKIFFPALKKLATDPLYTYDNTVTSADVEKLFSKAAGRDLKPLFHLYLYTTDKIDIRVKKIDPKTYEISLKNLDMTIPIEVTTNKGVEVLNVSGKPVRVTSDSQPIVDEKYFYLKRVVFE